MQRLRDSIFLAPDKLTDCSTIVFAVEELPADDWIPGESFTCVSGNEIRQALLLAIWRDIQAGVPTSVLEKWREAACTWPVMLKVVDKRNMLVECASLHDRRAAEAVEYLAPQQLQMLQHCVAQKRQDAPEATAEELHSHCKSSDSVRRPGSQSLFRNAPPQYSPASFTKLLDLVDGVWMNNECRCQIDLATASACVGSRPT